MLISLFFFLHERGNIIWTACHMCTHTESENSAGMFYIITWHVTISKSFITFALKSLEATFKNY
jgi:hypothetical protein